jgi:autotransporter-associated beta strand protein
LSLEQLEARNLLTTFFTPQFGVEQSFVASGPGAPLQSVPLCFVFWGTYWTTGSGPLQQSQILTAAGTICSSGFFSDEKKEYQTDGVVYVNDWDNDLTNPSQGFSQTRLNQVFQNAIDNGPLPESDNSIVGQAEYIVVTPPGIQSASGPNVTGYNTGTYHTLNFNIVSENFIWDGDGESNTFNLDQYTTTLSHEVAELTVNPVGYSGTNGLERVGYTVNPGAFFANPPGNSNQICDYEAQNYTARLNGVDVQSYWSYTNQDFIIPDNNTQNFYVDNGVLTLVGNQNGVLNNSFSVEATAAGGLEADMNGESDVFDPNEITSVIVFGGYGNDTLNIGAGILGKVPVTFSAHGAGQPFIFSHSQLTIQGQEGTSHNDSIFIGSDPFSLQATENGDTVTFQPGAISKIQVNLGSGNDTIELSGDVPAVVSSLVFTNISTPGSEALTVDNDTPVADATYSVGVLYNGNPLTLNYTGWINPLTYLGNFTSVTLDMIDASADNDQTAVNVQNLGAATTLNLELGLGVVAVDIGDSKGANEILGNVNISDDPNPGSSTISLDVNDRGDTASRYVTLENATGQPGWGSITGFGSSGAPEINYQYSTATTLTLESDAAVGNSINVYETGVTTDIVIDAVTYAYLGDANAGTRDLLGNVSLSSYEGGTPDQGNLYLTLDDLADPTPRTITLSTFTPQVYYGFGLYGPDTPWGSVSGLTPSPAAITYEYADTHSVTIEGNSGDQIVNNQTGSGQTPVSLDSAPVVTSISPDEGPLGGGTVVRIDGTGFTGSPWVSFGNSVVFPDPNYQNTSSVLYVIAPPSTTAGAVNLYVWNNVTLSSAVQFTYVAAPKLTSLNPAAGPVTPLFGIAIDGQNLAGATSVNFGQTAVTNFTYNPFNPDEIDATPPAASGPETVQVTVTTAGGPSNSLPYTYTSLPVVSLVSPPAGPLAGGTVVTITGSNLEDATEVSFGKFGPQGTVTPGTIYSAAFISDTASQIKVYSPNGTNIGGAGTLDVQVLTTPGSYSQLSSADHFTYVLPPAVTGVSPNVGPYEGGTTVAIAGSNLANATAVDFGNSPATSFGYYANGILWATSPGHAAVEVDVTVVTAGGTSPTGSSDKFYYQYETPIVSKVSPSTGAASGGTMVTITGEYLLSTQQVFFGSVPATSYQVLSDTQIMATCPPGTAGSQVDVTVVAEGLQSAASSADKFTYATLPIVSGLSPSSGPVGGGTTVAITGMNLSGATSVDFGGVAVPVNPAQDTGTQIVVTSPAGAAGMVDVTVVDPNGTSATSSADKFTYYVPVAAPSVTSLSPASGPVGVQTMVTISGSSLSDPTAVDFGNIPAMIESFSDGQISVKSPATVTPGPVYVTVTTAAGTSATGAADVFTYYGAAPTILGLYRPTGGLGNVGPANFSDGDWGIEIYGANLAGATAVYFGGLAVTSFQSDTATAIYLNVPEEGPGTVPVTVTTPSGTSAAVPYTFTSAPVFIDFNGTSPYAPLGGGTTLMIRGIDLANATSVNFGSTQVASFTYIPFDASGEYGALTLTTPPGAGTVMVTVTSPEGTSANVSTDLFTYLPVPTVTGISPAAGPLAGGNMVAIDGTGLTDVTEVDFGGIPDLGIFPFDTNTIYVDAPAGAALGTVDVTVTTGGGTSAVNSPADQYTYLPAPTVSGLSRTSGAVEGGTPVTISGMGLAGITAIDFGGEPADLSELTYNPDGSITVISPASPGANADTVDVTVTTYDGTSAINQPADQFSYTLAPYITSLDTTVGLVAGGTSVTISGDDLAGVTAVNFGNTPATSFTDNGDGTITAVSPPGSVGTVNVFVTTPAGTSDIVAADQFTYGEFPTVASVSPPTGSTNGGTQVTINGIGLANATQVNFGYLGAAFTFVSDTDMQIVIDSPYVSSQGTVDVTVLTALGTSVVNQPADQFTYVAPPVITSLDTTNGSVLGNTQVTITGTGLAGATEVDFGSNPAGIVSDADNQGVDTLVVNTPAATGGLPGAVDVTVTTPYGSVAYNSFIYWLPSSITGISPASGPAAGNTAVTISGTNLANVTAVNFGSDPAFSFSYDGSTGSIIAYSPAGSPSTVDITLVGPAGTSQVSAADQFTYLAAPSVTSISPAAGPEAGGTAVTIAGTDLSSATQVDFNGSAATSFTVNPDGSITVASPNLGITGAVDVTVLTPSGTSPISPADEFTYDAAPTVTGVSPSWGSTNGATVTITGTDLEDVTSVFFGGNAGSITDYSPGQIEAVAPAGSPGLVNVTVVTPGGTSAISPADQFTYIGAPAAATDSYSVALDSTRTVSGPGVLANDTDPQGLPLTATLLAEPLDGTLSLGSNGSFTYTPNVGFVGADAFVYQANNGYLASDPTLVSISVGQATLTWDGVATGDWTDSQWTGANLPYPVSGVNAVVDTPSVVQVSSAQAANALAISGGGQVAVAGPASLAVSTDTSVTGGTLSVASSGLFSTGGTFTLDTGGIVSGGPVSAAAYQLNDGTASAALSGPGGVTKDTGGTVTLSGVNSYLGGTLVDDGTLIAASPNSLPVGSSLTVGAGGTSLFGPGQAASPAVPATAAPEISPPPYAGEGGHHVPMVGVRAGTTGHSSINSLSGHQLLMVAGEGGHHVPMVGVRAGTTGQVENLSYVPAISPAAIDAVFTSRTRLDPFEGWWDSSNQTHPLETLDSVLARFGMGPERGI